MTGVSERIRSFGNTLPDAVALRRDDFTLTYRELNDRADHLASRFIELGVQRGDTVAISLERSFDSIVTALATMRVGAAFVPIDPSWPDERIRFVTLDSSSRVLVARADLLERLSLNVAGLDPCRDAQVIAAAPQASLPESAGDDLAYVIYTSGTTGTPKGVEITRANLEHLIAWHCRRFAITNQDRGSHLAGLGFDAAIWEVWPYLASSASVSLADDTTRISPELLQQWILAQHLTVSFVPTALAADLIAMPWPASTKLRTLLTGGDKLHKAPPAGLPFEVVNNYGPTECTVVATSGLVEPGSPGVPSIGKPIDGAPLYLLDDLGAQVPQGSTGEIFIGGTGVGRGYRNLPELSAQSFVADPFSAVPGAKMYRTGDLGVVLADGQIEFRGRSDHQVKIRGQRVELDEIGSVLHRHPEVAFAVVDARTAHDGGTTLVAHVLPREGASLSQQGLQQFLLQSLPAYMVPAAFVRLRELPLSANGKVDRARLEEPGEQNSLAAEPERQPQSLIEESLLSMVRELLQTDAVSVSDDFFLVGGHSLLGTQLVLRVRSAFGIDLNLRDLFEASTVESLATVVEARLLEELDAMTDEEALRQVSN